MRSGPQTSPANAPSAEEILRVHNQTLNAFLKRLCTSSSAVPPKLLEAIEYSLLAGGKRLRPALVMESFRACGGNKDEGGRMKDEKSGSSFILHPSSFDSALAAAGAIALIHTSSLVPDDLPVIE